MVYSQAKVIAGGLAHIPIVIAVFYFIMTFFNKRAIGSAEATKSKKEVNPLTLGRTDSENYKEEIKKLWEKENP